MLGDLDLDVVLQVASHEDRVEDKNHLPWSVFFFLWSSRWSWFSDLQVHTAELLCQRTQGHVAPDIRLWLAWFSVSMSPISGKKIVLVIVKFSWGRFCIIQVGKVINMPSIWHTFPTWGIPFHISEIMGTLQFSFNQALKFLWCFVHKFKNTHVSASLNLKLWAVWWQPLGALA